jgi:hypothetical protein
MSLAMSSLSATLLAHTKRPHRLRRGLRNSTLFLFTLLRRALPRSVQSQQTFPSVRDR